MPLSAKICLPAIGERPEIVERMQADGGVPDFDSPEGPARVVEEDVARWLRIVEISGIGG